MKGCVPHLDGITCKCSSLLYLYRYNNNKVVPYHTLRRRQYPYGAAVVGSKVDNRTIKKRDKEYLRLRFPGGDEIANACEKLGCVVNGLGHVIASLYAFEVSSIQQLAFIAIVNCSLTLHFR